MKTKNRNLLVWTTVAIQIFCALLFGAYFILETYLPVGLNVGWQVYELVEIVTAFGLVLGAVMGVILARQLLKRNERVEEQLRVVSGEFQKMLEENFDGWGLSPSERDVAYFAIKGMSNNEIAELRGTSEGTVKAQMNAVYKKAAVESRTQLLGYFIEELLAEDGENQAA